MVILEDKKQNVNRWGLNAIYICLLFDVVNKKISIKVTLIKGELNPPLASLCAFITSL